MLHTRTSNKESVACPHVWPLVCRVLTAAFVAGLALSLAPRSRRFTPTRIRSFASRAFAWRRPRVRAPQPVVRVRSVERVRTVERVRYVPVYYTSGCGGCAPAVVAVPAPQPVVYRAAYTTCGGCAPAVAAPTYYAPRYYAPTYYSGCGGCAQPAAAPYYWAVRTARYWHAHGYYSLKESQRPVAVRRIETPDPPSNPSTL